MIIPRARLAILERFGMGRWSKLPQIQNSIWIHCASLGEVAGAKPIVLKLAKMLPEEIKIIITTMSLVGRESAEKIPNCHMALLIPFDNVFLIRKVLRKISPELLLIMETELWPSLVLESSLANVPIVIANGRLSKYSFPKYRLFKSLVKPMLSAVNCLIVQTENDGKRFVDLGFNPQRLIVGGSSKYDTAEPDISVETVKTLRMEKGISFEDFVFVAGSVRLGEDEQIVKACKEILTYSKNVYCVIAPRYLKDVSRISKLCSELKLSVSFSSNFDVNARTKIRILDTFGELMTYYRLANAAFVGATLVDLGGHNPMEPASCSLPIFVGPYTSNVDNEVKELELSGGLEKIANGNELVRNLQILIQDSNKAKTMGRAAKVLWLSNRGIVDKICKKIYQLRACRKIEIFDTPIIPR